MSFVLSWIGFHWYIHTRTPYTHFPKDMSCGMEKGTSPHYYCEHFVEVEVRHYSFFPKLCIVRDKCNTVRCSVYFIFYTPYRWDSVEISEEEIGL